MNENLETSLDGVVYPIASDDQGRLMFHIAEMGKRLVQSYPSFHEGVGQDIDSHGYLYTENLDASVPRKIRSGIKYTTTPTIGNGARSWFFEAQDSGGTKYVYLNGSGSVFKFSQDGTTLHETKSFAGTSGRPAYWGGKWYVPRGDSQVAHRLDTVATPPTLDTWDNAGGPAWSAIGLSTFMAAGTSKIARIYGSNKIDVATVAPLSNANPGDFAGGYNVGDSSTVCNDIIENQGLLFVAKTDNLFEFDSDNNSRPVLPFMPRNNADTNNGRGMWAFGDLVFYPTANGLWRYRIGSGAIPIGPETLFDWSAPPNLPTPNPFQGDNTYGSITSSGEWIWVASTITSPSNYTCIFAGRLRRVGDPSTSEMIWHLPITIAANLYPTIYIASDNRLWCAQNLGGSYGLRVYRLGSDGSPRSAIRDGASGGRMICTETDFGEPTIRKQLRACYIDYDNFSATIPNVYVSRDGAAYDALGSLDPTVPPGSPITWVAGTNDKCTRARPRIDIGFAGGEDWVIRSITLVARSPSIYQLVIPTDEEISQAYGTTMSDTFQNLLRLVDKGPINVLPPGVGELNTWRGYVTQVKEVSWITGRLTTASGVLGDTGGRLTKGIEVTIERYSTDGT